MYLPVPRTTKEMEHFGRLQIHVNYLRNLIQGVYVPTLGLVYSDGMRRYCLR